MGPGGEVLKEKTGHEKSRDTVPLRRKYFVKTIFFLIFKNKIY
jgi:hypothetical protein